MRRLAAFLEGRGADVWLDEKSASPGDMLVEAIGEGLAAADAVVVVLSRASVASSWVHYEIATVLPRVVTGTCRLVPVRKDDVPVPPELKGLIYADFRRNARSGYDGLARGLGSLLKTVDLLPPARRGRSMGGSATVVSAAESISRGEFLAECISRIFDATEVRYLGEGGPTVVDFGGRPRDDRYDQWMDELEVYYEDESGDYAPSGHIWPPRRATTDLDDDWLDEWKNTLAEEPVHFYHLLLADRPIKFKLGSVPFNGETRLQVDGLQRGSWYPDGPKELWMSIDLTGITSRSGIERYLRQVRRTVLEDNRRWIALARDEIAPALPPTASATAAETPREAGSRSNILLVVWRRAETHECAARRWR